MLIGFLTAVFLAALTTVIIAFLVLSGKKEDDGTSCNAGEEHLEEETAEDLANAEVIARHTFWDNETDKLLRKRYPSLRQWSTLGHPIGNNFDGPHLCELLFWNGTKEIVTVIIKADIAMDIPDKASENEAKEEKSPEITAKEWIEKNKEFLLEKYYKGEGFLIESRDLPGDELTIDFILTYITAGGNFSTHYGPEGIRCVAEY